eukprot:scaffold2047_cov129-Cylindrotheca_fusiformis.AAC.46
MDHRPHYHRGGGGGRHHRNRRGGRGGRHRHQPYNSRGPRRGGGRGGPGNRFGGGQQAQQDPETALVRQVASFVSRAGELKNIKESTVPELRPVESTAAANVNDLTPLLCSQDKVELLLKYQQPSPEFQQVKALDQAGKLVHLVVSCAAGLPLQTPCYAALTISVHEHVKGSQWDGFASRCVDYTMIHIARDLDTILLLGQNQAQSACRVKLMLRYLAILGRIGVVKGFESREASDPNRMTVFDLLCLLVELAKAAAGQHNNTAVASVLVFLVLSTIPYIADYVPPGAVSEKLLVPIDSFLQTYTSTFSPGVGVTSILLKEEQMEDDDADIDDDESDVEEDDAQAQVCDSLQDLVRACKSMGKEGQSSRYCLPIDAPWKGLAKRTPPNPESGESEVQPFSYSEESVYLSFKDECQTAALLIRGDSQFKLECFKLRGIIFGRLPIFGSPLDPDDEEDAEAEAQKSAELKAYEKGFGLLDRYFIGEAVRDCLISHESSITGTGLEQGSVKSAAEELLSLPHAFTGENPSFGFEFAILENILALIAQTTEDSSLCHTYLSRVLLELVRLDPGRFSPALALGLGNLFQDYMPALVPRARENLSRWFAFHLINTNYQWPSAYWQMYEPYAVSTTPSSRGTFVRRALNLMGENVADPSEIVSSCFSDMKGLAGEIVGRKTATIERFEENSAIASLQSEVQNRVWGIDEDPSLLAEFLVGDEVSAKGIGGNWFRTDVLIRVLLDPANNALESLQSSLEPSVHDEDQMDEGEGAAKDVLMVVTDALSRYKPTLTASITRDSESAGSDENAAILGGAVLLRRVESMTSFNSSLMEGVVSCLVRQNVISGFSVLRWVLADTGESPETELVSRWYIYATNSIRESIVTMEGDQNGNGGMTIDRGSAESDEEFLNTVATHLKEALHYAAKRVAILLSKHSSAEKRLNPMQVELVEGMKGFAYISKAIVSGVLEEESGHRKALLPDEVQALFAKFDLSGPVLTQLCTGEQGHAVELLQRILLSV